ncbi:MAG TPA: YajD family HNH nuclease [Acidiferrobacter sp.]|nr:YajD family HNH nuclease [Acidiferrobacter sp.]
MKKKDGARRPGDSLDGSRLDAIVAKAHKEVDTRMRGYREQSLRLHPRVCARCGREFDTTNLHELTVHHKDHNHDNNPPDGSNWENLCLYCHDWEHQKYSYAIKGADAGFGLTNTNGHANANASPEVTHNPFAALKDVLGKNTK